MEDIIIQQGWYHNFLVIIRGVGILLIITGIASFLLRNIVVAVVGASFAITGIIYLSNPESILQLIFAMWQTPVLGDATLVFSILSFVFLLGDVFVGLAIGWIIARVL